VKRRGGGSSGSAAFPGGGPGAGDFLLLVQVSLNPDARAGLTPRGGTDAAALLTARGTRHSSLVTHHSSLDLRCSGGSQGTPTARIIECP
jgi:hypothetical protein